jgi:hypothetical protein
MRCLICSARGRLTLHHVTGRPHGASPYFDPDLVFTLCLRCNVEQDHVWRRGGLYEPMSPVCARLLRAACWFDVVADRGRHVTLNKTQALALAHLMQDAVHDLPAGERRAALGWVATFEALECHRGLVLAPQRSRALALALRAAASLREEAR